jgi:hypothetical protein
VDRAAIAARADAFEAAVFRALELDDADAPIARWAEIYAHVSSVLTRDVEAGRFDAPSTLIEGPVKGRWADIDIDAVWGLVYAARTHLIASRILAAHPPPPGPCAELGAGWGPFGLAAAFVGFGPIHLMDVSKPRLDRAARLFDASGLEPPILHPGDVSRSKRIADLGPLSAIALPFAFGEMLGRDATDALGAERVEAWLDSLAPGGRLYIVEPGSQASSRRLQSIRDRVQLAGGHVVAPCCGVSRCPMLVDKRDWCHLTWRMPLGRVGRAIAEAAHRRWQEVHFSWLVLGRKDDSARADGLRARLVEIRSVERGKITARFCGPDGLVTLTALRRHAACFDRIAGLEPGAVVRWRAEGLERHGDGLRLIDPSALLVLVEP